MLKETQIKHENGKYWVLEVKKGMYQVMISGLTHSTCDSAYNDLSLAIYRCDYLAKRA
ncbi:hypothetical protein SP6_1 [Salmonella phage SP6]|uniref:0.2 n=2 Tax=Enterobacteria phage SP6 TaxID=2907955 RepID=Q6UGL7_BPSP6|nr:hypothetical protein SP6p01 [Salmonella phage SP6]AAP48740.1 gp1 [Salmonella phage SP6]AAR89992.1 0.2 [Salmonella phage SP6]